MEWTDNEIGAEGTKAISELLESNGVLSEMNLGSEKKFRKNRRIHNRKTIRKRTDNEIGEEGIKSLSEVMKVNSTLISLDLSGERRREKRIEVKNEV